MVEQLNALQLPSSPIESFDADQNESRLETCSPYRVNRVFGRTHTKG